MPDWQLKLLYDGQCPFCRREVDWLRRRDRAGRLAFEDIAAVGHDPAQYGLTTEEVQSVLHAVSPNGRVLRRVEAIRAAYRAIGLGWLVAPTGWPGLRWICDRLYGLFARNRVRLGCLIGRRCSQSTPGTATPRSTCSPPTKSPTSADRPPL